MLSKNLVLKDIAIRIKNGEIELFYYFIYFIFFIFKNIGIVWNKIIIYE